MQSPRHCPSRNFRTCLAIDNRRSATCCKTAARYISIDLIDEGVQTRADIDPAAVMEFAEAMEPKILEDGTRVDGERMPPLLVFEIDDSGRYLLAGGHHRLRAAKKAGRPEVLCIVREGTVFDAFCASATDNAEHHALCRSNKDKHYSVRGFLQRFPDHGLKDREIAKLLRVSHSLIQKVRTKMLAEAVNVYSTDDSAELAREDKPSRDASPASGSNPPESAATHDGTESSATPLSATERQSADSNVAPVDVDADDDDVDDRPSIDDQTATTAPTLCRGAGL